MDNTQQEAQTEPKTSQKKVGGHSKKSSNKPSGNPMGGRSRAKSTVLSVFEKNLKANSQTMDNNNKKIEVEGFDRERFKNLKAMFEKKPDERLQEENQIQYGAGKIDPLRFKAFAGDSKNEEKKQDMVLESNQNAPRMSIKDRINMLMKSKEESQPNNTGIDPILEKLRETKLDDNEDSGDDYSEDNLDISKGEENDEDNDALDKSESLSDEANKKEKTDEVQADEKEIKDNNVKDSEQNNKNDKKEDLDKSESLDDD